MSCLVQKVFQLIIIFPQNDMGNIFIKLIKSNTTTIINKPSHLVQLPATESTEIDLQRKQSNKKGFKERKKRRKNKVWYFGIICFDCCRTQKLVLQLLRSSKKLSIQNWINLSLQINLVELAYLLLERRPSQRCTTKKTKPPHPKSHTSSRIHSL